MTTWAGRVDSALDPDVWRFLRVDDAELLPYDCEATAEHARRLASAGLLTDAELDDAESRLSEIAQDPCGTVTQRSGRRGLPNVRAGRVRRGA